MSGFEPWRGASRGRENPPAGAVVPFWRKRLICGANGKPKPLLANAMLALRGAPEWRGVLAFDSFSMRTLVRAAPPWKDGKASLGWWTNCHDIKVTEWLQHEGIDVSVDVAAQAVEGVAREHPVHPVREYLQKLKWDDKPRLDSWLIEYLGVEDCEFARAVGARWMISAVARVMKPGSKADCALILEGSQGTLKSTALKALADPWFTDEMADIGSKDAAMQTSGVWIVELAELESIKGRDTTKIKAFLSRTTDRFRPPYGRRVGEYPRQCVFAGTTNRSDYLHDETGNRRFWPIKCMTIRIEALRRDRGQLWAEAYARYTKGEPWWLDELRLHDAAVGEQEARAASDPWEEPIRDYLVSLEATNNPSTSIAEIFRAVLGLPVQDREQRDENRIARCLTLSGWERYQARGHGRRRTWRYRPKPVSPVPK